MARNGGNGSDGEPREGSAAGRLAREVSSLQASLLGKLHDKMTEGQGEEFAAAAQGIAEAFGSVTAVAIDPLLAPPAPPDAHPSLYRNGHMRRRLDQMIESYRRYGHSFGLVVLDVHGPGAQNGSRAGAEGALTVVGAALRDSVRLVDEAFHLEEDALCLLAPGQNTVGGVQMAGRLLSLLAELEAAGGLPIGISAGVVACPEHGADAEGLLRKADEAMWRARAVGQPVGVGVLEVLQDR